MAEYGLLNPTIHKEDERASLADMAALTAEADRLEDAKYKDHRSEGAARLVLLSESPLDLWTESTALLTLSARSAELR